MNECPRVRNKLRSSIEQLKNMGEQLGPEAKKKVDETWEQIKDILQGGVTP